MAKDSTNLRARGTLILKELLDQACRELDGAQLGSANRRLVFRRPYLPRLSLTTRGRAV
jgi:hypothetical protein